MMETSTASVKRLTLSKKEAAEQLGVSLPTLDKLIRKKQNPLPAFHAGKSVKILAAKLDDWAKEELRLERESKAHA